jgi:signal transduction histidine kinase
MSETGWRPWLPAIAALVVLAIGFTEAALLWAMTQGAPGSLPAPTTGRMDGFAVALAVAFAVGLCRRAPGAALGLVWGLGLFHVRFGVPIMLTEVALTAVFFAGARWGRPPTVVTSALSVPLAVVVAFVLHDGRLITLQLLVGGLRLDGFLRQDPTLPLALSLIGLLVVAAPWPAGLVMRFLERASTSQASMLAAEEAAAGARRETEHAREIAQLRDQQTSLARDVHDVVGHSLAVILAQAESGQYLHDSATLKTTLQTIATSARSSLQDVRQVLSSTQDTNAGTDDAGWFDSLIAGVRGSGHGIIAASQGPPRHLPRETVTVAYRVFQEMLTNAIKHGRRDRPITAEQHWPQSPPETLRVTVTNEVCGDDPASPGRGLDGMRRRLEAIGGRLDVRRDGSTFTVDAYLPVPA